MMKTKGRKLSIHRETIRVLTRGEAARVNGGNNSDGAPCGGITKVRAFAASDGGPCTAPVKV